MKNLSFLFRRELEKLMLEINSYQNESNLWIINKDIKNSGGTLCLHICGNLKTYIGAELGKTGYIRNREMEFSEKNIPKEKLIENIKETIIAVTETLEKLNLEDYDKIYPQNVLGYEMTTGFFLIHLFGHLGYHLGQINYHRRLLDN